jgi:UPF0176 protein
MTDEQIIDLKNRLSQQAVESGMRGLFLLGREGINATVSGTAEAIENFKKTMTQETVIGDLHFKDSYCDFLPFRLMKFDVREEIVTIGNTEVLPTEDDRSTHLSPQDWHRAIEEKKGVFLDTRNWYEFEIGTFEGAMTLPIDHFSDFAEEAEKRGVKKDEPVFMFCTGGIRCEKAIPEMKRRGFKEVYQLDGGILNYLKEFPNGKWNGECFVFDHRVAVDTNLQPTKQYGLCPHCGQPAKITIDCARCEEPAKVCQSCLDKEPKFHTCSKNCAHHHSLGSRVRVKNQTPGKITRQNLRNTKITG